MPAGSQCGPPLQQRLAGAADPKGTQPAHNPASDAPSTATKWSRLQRDGTPTATPLAVYDVLAGRWPDPGRKGVLPSRAAPSRHLYPTCPPDPAPSRFPLCRRVCRARGRPPACSPGLQARSCLTAPDAFGGEGRDSSPDTEEKRGRGHRAVPSCGPVTWEARRVFRNSAHTALGRETRVPGGTDRPSERGTPRPGPRTQPLGPARATHPSRARRLFTHQQFTVKRQRVCQRIIDTLHFMHN